MKTMNKYLKNMMLAAVAVLTMTSFAACSDDDKKDDPEEPKTGEFVYKYYLNEELLEVADLAITYTDCDGKKVTEQVTAEKCTKETANLSNPELLCYPKEIEAASLPATSGFEAVLTQKEVPTDFKYDLTCGMKYGFVLSNGTQLTLRDDVTVSKGVDNLNQFINARNKASKHTLSVNADGVLE